MRSEGKKKESKMLKKILLLSLLIIILFFSRLSSVSPQQDYGAPQVSVTHAEGNWIISGQRHKVLIDEVTLKMTVHDDAVAWLFLPSMENDLTIGLGTAKFPVKLSDAGKIEFESYENGYKTGIKIHLNQFRYNGNNLDLELELFVCLEGVDEDLVCEIIAGEKESVIKECLWPKGLEPNTVDFTVVPFMQGMLLPKNWNRRVRLYNTETYGRGLYMPWWGFQQGSSSALVLLETSEDAGCRFEHPAGGPTKMELRWMHSLGRLDYPRRVRFCFFREGNYVNLAKRYRKYLIDTGKFISLKEKITRNPLVKKLIGSPVVHTSILYHIQPTSSYYNAKDTSKNHQIVSFYDRAEHLRKLAAKRIKRAYVHLDGWGYRGYDNLHPDIVPPCPEAGGWDGMKKFGDVCDELGYIFALHDQYRDYYHDAASYNPRHTIINENGKRPFEHTWYGGNQSILCSRLAPGHVAKNHAAIHARGIKVKGAYLDVFAVVPPDECYNPEHPATREDCLKYRGDCFDIIRSYGGVVSSEEPADWAIPYLDLVHHGPYALDPNPGQGPAMGIPVPLFNLVYHDAIILPWSAGIDKGTWGIPDTDQGYLHCLANAGIPYLSLDPDEAELIRMKKMCALHERVGLLEMTKHEFLDSSYRRQRTTFSDGTTVTINLDSDSFEINPNLAP